MNNVALLIDWENIKASAVNALQTPPDIITLKKIARKFGTLRIARAYANWTDCSGWHSGDVERLSAQGIEPIFVPTKHLTRGRDDGGDLYEKDLVDLRLACDGMELLATHPEIGCYVLVSGDGALETLLSKLSASGKRVVRVAVEESLAKGMRVLGEERVIYDHWIKGFRIPADAAVDAAVAKLAAAVDTITASGADNGLHAVKERMRRDEPEFEEETLGVPTFRHLAYLAEARGLIRVDASPEPAKAYPGNADRAADRTLLPCGETWRAFIRQLDSTKEYNKSGLEASFEGVDLGVGRLSLRDLVNLALRSDVLVGVSERYVTRDYESQQAREIPTMKYRLNAHHPRVQVVMAAANQVTA
jgi:uncharacterized LabA/DUF88 family protein